MGKRDPNIIRVGDQVKVIKPDFFVRCGYRMSFEEGRKYVRESYDEEIARFIEQFYFTRSPYRLGRTLKSNDEDRTSPTFRKIVDALAYEYIRSQGFGGNERTIHTIHAPDYEGCILWVDDIKRVVTGTYSPGHSWGGIDFNGYDPPMLENQKHHKILLCSPLSGVFFNSGKNGVLNHDIEAVNVEKVMPDGVCECKNPILHTSTMQCARCGKFRR